MIFSGLGNDTVEIVNTFEAKLVQSIKGQDEPQGPLYVPEFDKLFVANAGNGMVNVYDGEDVGPSQEYFIGRGAPIRTMFGMTRLQNGFLSASWAASP